MCAQVPILKSNIKEGKLNVALHSGGMNLWVVAPAVAQGSTGPSLPRYKCQPPAACVPETSQGPSLPDFLHIGGEQLRRADGFYPVFIFRRGYLRIKTQATCDTRQAHTFWIPSWCLAYRFCTNAYVYFKYSRVVSLSGFRLGDPTHNCVQA